MHRSKPLFDHFIGGNLQRERHCQIECLGGLEIDDQLIMVWSFDWRVAWLGAVQYSWAMTMARGK
jgi:hypothetical protein